MNTYAYVNGNPTGFIDPTGLDPTALTLRGIGGLSLFIPVPGARPLGLGLIALSLSGDTDRTRTEVSVDGLSQCKIDEDGFVSLFHGTDIASATALLNGSPLNAGLAVQQKFPSEVGLSPVGFFLTPEIGAAEMFAARREGGVIQFNFTPSALQQVIAAGSVIQPIPPGRLPASPGTELIVLPSAFPAFNQLRTTGQINAVPAPSAQ